MNSKGEWNGSRIPRVVVEVADEVQEEEGEEQRNFKSKKIDKSRSTGERGRWNMENLKKRKRGQDETEEKEKVKRIKESVESGCGPAEPVSKKQHCDKDMVDQPECGPDKPKNMQKTNHSEKRDKKKQSECGPTEPECTVKDQHDGKDRLHEFRGGQTTNRLSVEMMCKSGCGTAKLAKPKCEKKQLHPRKIDDPKCGMTQPTCENVTMEFDNELDNLHLYQAVEGLEICLTIAEELMGEVLWGLIPAKIGLPRVKIRGKRRIPTGTEKIRKDSIKFGQNEKDDGDKLGLSYGKGTKRKKETQPNKQPRSRLKEWLEIDRREKDSETIDLLHLKPKSNSNLKTRKLKRGKSKTDAQENQKITNFFNPVQKQAELDSGLGVKQLSLRNSGGGTGWEGGRLITGLGGGTGVKVKIQDKEQAQFLDYDSDSNGGRQA